MLVLGISALYHDSAAVILRDGQIVAAAQEERFTRIRHDAAFPEQAIKYCLQEAGVSIDAVDHVAFYDKPFLKFERLLETYLSLAPRGFRSFGKALPIWLKEKLFQKKLMIDALVDLGADKATIGTRLLFGEHHQSHAASAFYPSPFDEAAILTLDGVGEWATTTLGVGRGNSMELLREIHFPHSLGLLYSAFTYYTGFKVNSGEYKVMGLAPYGRPIYADKIRDHLIDMKPDGSFRLDMAYFDYCGGLRMTTRRFDDLFGGPPRDPETPLTQRHMDLAASIQLVTEEVVLALAKGAHAHTGLPNLCLAGGVALNCVANGRLLREGPFDKIWIQPAAGDAGGALGAALAATHWHLDHPRRALAAGEKDHMAGSYLGPSFGQAEIIDQLNADGAVFEELSDAALVDQVAAELEKGAAVGWFQGRMEFGPRALGGRSILGDPRSPEMQKTLNLKVKFRESFRPFAPSVRREDVAEWFELEDDSPYMLLVAGVQSKRRVAETDGGEDLFGLDRLNQTRSEIPAVTHVDYSARIQTVDADTNPRYHALLTRFQERTGCPILVNTSFNVRGEPIVCTPSDAFRCFMGTDLDILAVGNCLLRKADQDPALAARYHQTFALD